MASNGTEPSAERAGAPPSASAARTLSLMQNASGLAFSTFAAAHFAGHIFLPFAAWLKDADGVMNVLRVYYQHPLLEPLLVPVSLALHIAAGAGKAYLRSKSPNGQQDASEPAAGGRWTWSRDAQRTSGWLLALIVPAHAVATRGAALRFLNPPSDMSYSYALSTLVFLPVWFLPYYTLLLSVPGALHAVHGMRYALSSLRARYGKSVPVPPANAISVVGPALAAGLCATVFTLWGWAYGWFGKVDREVEFQLPRWRELGKLMYGVEL
ncbi:hypothetical protein DFJ74DRAFT_237961 [Hyaloraphidium curvatum]|nr:hypothetical protein DFJ74DRAFT_237961 [Hyaloraphidium curvatum]